MNISILVGVFFLQHENVRIFVFNNNNNYYYYYSINTKLEEEEKTFLKITYRVNLTCFRPFFFSKIPAFLAVADVVVLTKL